jgi:thioredoxin reductase (NADPH)
MAEPPPRKLLIIGSGPAGLTAAIYAGRAGLAPLLLSGPTPGGQLTRTSEVENFPGFRKAILGPELMEAQFEQAKHCGAQVEYESATRIETSVQPFRVTAEGGAVHLCHALIFATGAGPRRLGAPGEEAYQPPNGSGVTYCAVCDGSFYRGRPVAVAGGGDAAMEEATYLSNLCLSVTLIHRREGFRASKALLDRARAKPNLSWELNQVVAEAFGDPKTRKLTGLRLKDVGTGRTKELAVAALFVAIGHLPATELLRGQVETDEEGYLKVNERQETSVPGLFAAGDCHDRRYRQAVVAAGMGCKAALEAERYLTHHGLT